MVNSLSRPQTNVSVDMLDDTYLVSDETTWARSAFRYHTCKQQNILNLLRTFLKKTRLESPVYTLSFLLFTLKETL